MSNNIQLNEQGLKQLKKYPPCDSIQLDPFHTDDCGHGGYICSYIAHKYHPEKRSVKCDLYVFDQKREQEVCIRTGEESDYISPGSIIQFVKSAARHGTDYDEYGLALRILVLLGTFAWNNEKKE